MSLFFLFEGAGSTTGVHSTTKNTPCFIRGLLPLSGNIPLFVPPFTFNNSSIPLCVLGPTGTSNISAVVPLLIQNIGTISGNLPLVVIPASNTSQNFPLYTTGPANGSIIVTANNGNTSAAATWSGGIPPGVGDSAVINHAVTVDTPWIVGPQLCTSPYSAPSATAAGGGAVSGNLPAGNYIFSYSHVGTNGETYTTAQTNAVNVSAGNIPRVTFSSMPSGVQSFNLYMTNTGGAAGTERLYANGITTATYDCASSGWLNGTSTFAAAPLPPTSQARGSAILVNSTGSVVVNSGIQLTHRGDIYLANTQFTMLPGSILENDGSPYTSGLAGYDFRFGTAAGQTNTRFIGSGTITQPCIVRANSGGMAGQFRQSKMTSANGQALFDCNNTTFLHLGDINTTAINMNNSSAYVQNMIYCIFDTLGLVAIPNGTPTNGGWIFDHCTFQNSIGQRNTGTGRIDCFSLAVATGVPTASRIVSNNVFDRAPIVIANGTVWNNNFLNALLDPGIGPASPMGSFSGNFVRFTANTSETVAGWDMKNVYTYFDSVTNSTNLTLAIIAPSSNTLITVADTSIFSATPNANNSTIDIDTGSNYEHATIKGVLDSTHLVANLTKTHASGVICAAAYYNPHGFGVGNTTWDGLVFEYNGTDANGDLTKDYGTPSTRTVKNTIALPNGKTDWGIGYRDNSGTFFTMAGGAGGSQGSAYIYNNTIFTGGQSAAVNEGGSFTGQPLQAMMGNLCWADNGVVYAGVFGPYILNCSSAGGVAATTLNQIPQSGLNFNAMWNGRDVGFAFSQYGATQSGVGKFYRINEDSASGTMPFGQNDVNLGSGGLGPRFVDSDRNFRKWAYMIGASGAGLTSNYDIIKYGLDALRAVNQPLHPNYNPSASISGLLLYVKNGFVVQNSALHGTSFDGGDIGAMPFFGGTSSAVASPVLYISGTSNTNNNIPLFITPDVTIPFPHPRVFFGNPAYMAQATGWWASHSFVPPNPPYSISTTYFKLGLAYLMTSGATQSGYLNTIKNLLFSETPGNLGFFMNYAYQGNIDDNTFVPIGSEAPYLPVGATPADGIRAADWIVPYFDWTYNQLTPAERDKFMSGWTTTWQTAGAFSGQTVTIPSYTKMMINELQQPWGSPDPNSIHGPMPGSNYYWGRVRNATNYALSIWYEDPTSAQSFYNQIYDPNSNSFWTVFKDFWLNKDARGGVPTEGPRYGRYQLQYPVVPFISLLGFGKDLLAECGYWSDALLYLIHVLTPQPTLATTSNYYQHLPYSDDDLDGGYPSLQTNFDTNYFGDFLTMLSLKHGPSITGLYARQMISLAGLPVDAYVSSLETNTSKQDWTLDSLPRTQRFLGMEYIAARNTWASGASCIFIQNSGVNNLNYHHHSDYGSFQLYRGNQWLSKEATGYGLTVANYKYPTTVAGSPLPTSGAFAGTNLPTTSGWFNPFMIRFLTGVNAGISGLVTSYNPNNIFNVNFLPNAPASGDKFVVFDQTGESASIYLGHNCILVGGFSNAHAGVASYAVGAPSSIWYHDAYPNYLSCAVDLTNTYPGLVPSQYPDRDNPYSKSVRREFYWLPTIESLVILDRIRTKTSTSTYYPAWNASGVTTTFLLHSPQPMIFDAPSQAYVNLGPQAMRLFTLLPSSVNYVTNHTSDLIGGLSSASFYPYRLEATDLTTGSDTHYQLNIIQARGSGDPDITASIIAQDSGTWTISISNPNNNSATLVLNKGLAAVEGSVTLNGINTISDSIPLFINNIIPSLSNNIPLFTITPSNVSNNIPLFTAPYGNQSANIPLYTGSSLNQSSGIPLFVGSFDKKNFNIPLMVSALGSQNANVPLYLVSAPNAHSGIPLCMASATATLHNNIPLYIAFLQPNANTVVIHNTVYITREVAEGLQINNKLNNGMQIIQRAPDSLNI